MAVQISAAGKFWLGELEHIFLLNQDSVGMHRFGKVRWLAPVQVNLAGTVWQDL